MPSATTSRELYVLFPGGLRELLNVTWSAECTVEELLEEVQSYATLSGEFELRVWDGAVSG